MRARPASASASRRRWCARSANSASATTPRATDCGSPSTALGSSARSRSTPCMPTRRTRTSAGSSWPRRCAARAWEVGCSMPSSSTATGAAIGASFCGPSTGSMQHAISTRRRGFASSSSGLACSGGRKSTSNASSARLGRRRRNPATDRSRAVLRPVSCSPVPGRARPTVPLRRPLRAGLRLPPSAVSTKTRSSRRPVASATSPGSGASSVR